MHKGKRILAIIMVIISLLLLLMFIYSPSIIFKIIVDDTTSIITYIDYCKSVARIFMDALNDTISFTSIFDELLIFSMQTLVVLFELFIFIRAFVSIFVRNAKCKVIGKVLLICLIHGVYIFLITHYDLALNTTHDITLNLYLMVGGNVLILILELFRRINIKTNPDDRKFETIDLIEFYRDKK